MPSKRKIKITTRTTTVQPGEETVTFPFVPASSEEYTPRLYTGSVIDGLYRIEKYIASGGMGEVYWATDLANDEAVAIKILKPHAIKSPEHMARFLREAEEWVRLGVHPNIVRAHTILEYEYSPLIVSEFVDGSSLHDLLKKQALSEADKFSIAAQICWSMDYAHGKGLAHRDLKPANVLVSKAGAAKVTDFGLAKRIDDKHDPAHHDKAKKIKGDGAFLTQGIIGTPAYMAPEQWDGLSTPLTDVYAFGIILYELFCGRRPFDFPEETQTQSITDYQDTHKNVPPPDPKSLNPSIHPMLRQLMIECVAKSTAQRPQSFAEVARRLDTISRALNGHGIPPKPPAEELDKRGQRDQAEAYMRLGLLCLFRGEYDRGIQLFDQAMPLFEHVGDQNGVASCLLRKGTAYYRKNMLDQAMAMFAKSLSIFDRIGRKQGISACYNNIGEVLLQTHNSQAARLYYRRALDLAVDLDTPERERLSSVCYNNLARTTAEQNDLSGAVKLLQKSLENAEAIRNRLLISEAHTTLGEIYAAAGRKAQARTELQKALEIMESIGYSRKDFVRQLLATLN